MYFSISQYPMLQSVSRARQREIVSAASAAYDKWSNKRFWFVVLSLLLASWSTKWLVPPQYLVGFRWLLIPAICALLFYAYLLWDINGPTLRAVQHYERGGSIA